MSHEGLFFCSQTIHRLGEYAKWPGANPRLPWHVDLAGYRGQTPRDKIMEAFRLAWLWWAEIAEIEPVMVQSAAEALIRKHFAAVDGPNGILAWSELADNTNQPKTQRYDAAEPWVLSESLQDGMDLARVACHEIGHVLGLEHDGRNADALMRPTISNSIRKPTARDAARLLALGYKKRTTPLPPPDDPPTGLPKPNMIRLKQRLPAGDHGVFTLGSPMTAGDYFMILGGDDEGPPDVPPE